MVRNDRCLFGNGLRILRHQMALNPWHNSVCRSHSNHPRSTLLYGCDGLVQQRWRKRMYHFVNFKAVSQCPSNKTKQHHRFERGASVERWKDFFSASDTSAFSISMDLLHHKHSCTQSRPKKTHPRTYQASFPLVNLLYSILHLRISFDPRKICQPAVDIAPRRIQHQVIEPFCSS